MKNDKQNIDLKDLANALKVKSNVRAGLVSPIAPISPVGPKMCFACGLSGLGGLGGIGGARP